MALLSESPRPTTTRNNLLLLPSELHAIIQSHLPNRDIKSIRLTCRYLCDTFSLRFDRVFLSANPRNIEVFRAIADHNGLRRKVTEIIWDDARLPDSPKADASGLYYRRLGGGFTTWDRSSFSTVYQVNIQLGREREFRNRETLDYSGPKRLVPPFLSIEDSQSYYHELLKEQEQVIASGSDVEVLAYGLRRFSSLRKITITPAAHGFPFYPLYETPMIRSFPHGFLYPTPRSWPTNVMSPSPTPLPGPWVQSDGTSIDQVTAEREKWRGFSKILAAVTKNLREQAHGHPCRISELVVDANKLATGLNCYIFDQPCAEYDDFCFVLQQPGFRRLDLDMMVDGSDSVFWESFPRLRQRWLHALGTATSLEHIRLGTSIISCPREGFIPLSSFFPIEKWPSLRHFGLSRFYVRQADVVGFLAKLPSTVRSVELSFLTFCDDDENYRDLLDDMSTMLDWKTRPVSERPTVTIGVGVGRVGEAVWISSHISDFLYGDGANPFGFATSPSIVFSGTGVFRDEFDAAYNEPN